MLYDPKWEAPTETDPASIDSLMAWMELHAPKAKYCYEDTGNCLIARYFAFVCGEPVQTGFISYRASSGAGGYIPDGWVSEIAKPEPHTFGAALSRARALRGS